MRNGSRAAALSTVFRLTHSARTRRRAQAVFDDGGRLPLGCGRLGLPGPEGLHRRR
ncbi:hypothetical protein [Streptomyces sp. I05A-00742]|uniref:hypothetical protein n=1 Tax=Streptomyces sp. I05A-00742 TaxID=2732853 RepID=UPI001489EBA2|nr:hypothetical protein [Streptomyces sp. I05A-00742]